MIYASISRTQTNKVFLSNDDKPDSQAMQNIDLKSNLGGGGGRVQAAATWSSNAEVVYESTAAVSAADSAVQLRLDRMEECGAAPASNVGRTRRLRRPERVAIMLHL